MRRACVNQGGRLTESGRSAAPGAGSRVRELAAARELLHLEHATSDHDRVLDVVAQRVLLDILEPGAHDHFGRDAQVVVSLRATGRIATPSAC